MVNAAIDLPVLVNVPVPKKVTVKLVYVPPAVNVKLFKLNVVVAGVHELPVKFNVLKKEEEKDGIAVPEVIDRFGALAAVPPLDEPKSNVLATVIAEVNPPVPVYVKPVAVVIASTVLPAVVWANMILLVPNVIDLTPDPVDENIPVVRLNPLSTNAPVVNVTVLLVAAAPYALVNVTVPAELLITKVPTLLPPALIVCVVPVNCISRLLYAPPVASTKVFGVVLPVTLVLVLPVKSNILYRVPVE